MSAEELARLRVLNHKLAMIGSAEVITHFNAVLDVLERQAATPAPTATTPRPDPSLRERVVNRLLALGYTDIRIVTGADELAELACEDAEGAVVVELRQGGSVLKGRVLLTAGSITDVQLKPFYPTFP